MDKPTPIFADGINFYRVEPQIKEKMPWLKGKLSINIDKHIEFLKEMKKHGYASEKGYIFVDLKESKAGSLYLQVNTYQKKEEPKAGKVESDEDADFKSLADSIPF